MSDLKGSVDKEMQQFRSKFKFYGYSKGRSIINVSDDLIQVALCVSKLPENTVVKGYKSAVSEIVPKAKSILEKYFNLHDVLYISVEDVREILSKHIDFENGVASLETIKNADSEIGTAAKYISPFDIPVTFVSGHSMVGEIAKSLLLFDNEEFLRQQPVRFSGVHLGDNVTLLSVATFGHEVVHSQIDSRKGSCTDFHNSEVLSIFMEKFLAYELDPSGELLKVSERMRNRSLLENFAMVLSTDGSFSRAQKIDASVYINSILKADRLFNMYINGDTDKQASIIAGIQDVFDGNSTVEEFLESTNITLENSAKSFCYRRRFKK